MTREQLIDKLVLSSHLNVAERKQLDPPNVSLMEVTSSIKKALAVSPFFPAIARPVSAGDVIEEPIYEGWFLERQDDSFVVHGQDCGPHPLAFRGRSSKRFASLEKAVEFFVTHEYDGNIDGIPIAL